MPTLRIPFQVLRECAMRAIQVPNASSGPSPEREFAFRASATGRGDEITFLYIPNAWRNVRTPRLLTGRLHFGDSTDQTISLLRRQYPEAEIRMAVGIGPDQGRAIIEFEDDAKVQPLELDIAGNSARRASTSGTDYSLRSRAIGVWGIDTQLAFESLRVGVIGCGGLGSVIAHQLAADGIRNLVLVDPSSYDRSDLGRSAAGLLTSGSIGENKASALADALRFTFDDCTTFPVPRGIESKAAAMALRDCDLLVDAVDTFGARRLSSRIACAYHIPIVSVGTGIFRHSIKNQGERLAIGSENAFVLPGDGCLACQLGLPLQDQSFEFETQRAGSLRSLNLWATAWAMRAIEEWLLGRLTNSRAQRYVWGPDGAERGRVIRPDKAGCHCNLSGLGDLAM